MKTESCPEYGVQKEKRWAQHRLNPAEWVRREALQRGAQSARVGRLSLFSLKSRFWTLGPFYGHLWGSGRLVSRKFICRQHIQQITIHDGVWMIPYGPSNTRIRHPCQTPTLLPQPWDRSMRRCESTWIDPGTRASWFVPNALGVTLFSPADEFSFSLLPGHWYRPTSRNPDSGWGPLFDDCRLSFLCINFCRPRPCFKLSHDRHDWIGNFPFLDFYSQSE